MPAACKTRRCQRTESSDNEEKGLRLWKRLWKTASSSKIRLHSVRARRPRFHPRLLHFPFEHLLHSSGALFTASYVHQELRRGRFLFVCVSNVLSVAQSSLVFSFLRVTWTTRFSFRFFFAFLPGKPPARPPPTRFIRRSSSSPYLRVCFFCHNSSLLVPLSRTCKTLSLSLSLSLSFSCARSASFQLTADAPRRTNRTQSIHPSPPSLAPSTRDQPPLLPHDSYS